MKTAVVLLFLAAVSGWAAQDDSKSKQAGKEKQNLVESPKVPATAAPETDPSKIAAPASTGAKAPGSAPVDDKTYQIGPEDMLFVQVWGNPALSGQSMVRSDGKITVGLIGEVQAAGVTPLKLSQDISTRLKDGGYLREPQVTVSVIQIKSKKYFILGEVYKPGSYDLIVPTTVLEALVNAGGFRDFANKKKILIQRGDKQLYFNYNQVIQGKNRQQNVLLEPGDQIIVK
jgi:polysaccharide biosynthesis/export protein